MSQTQGNALSSTNVEHRKFALQAPPTPRVSVLMPVFNTVAYLSGALESIRQQTFQDYELVVVDDGSNDGSTEVLRKYALVEPRMRLVVRGNRGLITTRNELLALARGELIAWMDSDDVSHPARLQLQTAAFDADNSLICVGGAALLIDPEGHPLGIERHSTSHLEILDGQLLGGGMRFPSTIMRRDAAIKVGGFREPFSIGEDFDLLLRLGEIGHLRNLAEVIYSYRQHVSSTFAQHSTQWFDYRSAILELARERREHGSDRLQRGETLTIKSTIASSKSNRTADAYADWAVHALRNGSFEHALRCAATALRTRPSSIAVWKLYMSAKFQEWKSRRFR